MYLGSQYKYSLYNRLTEPKSRMLLYTFSFSGSFRFNLEYVQISDSLFLSLIFDVLLGTFVYLGQHLYSMKM